MNAADSCQITCLMLVIWCGWSLTMTAHNGPGGWLVLMLAALLALAFTALCCVPSERIPQVSWFALPRALFGPAGGALYLLAVTVCAFVSLCCSVLSGVIFLRTVSGGQWPVWLLACAVLLCAAAAAQGGIRQLVLWTEPVVWLVLLALAVSLLLSVPHMQQVSLLPPDLSAVPRQTLLTLSVPFGEVFYAAAVIGADGSRTRSGLQRACVLAGIVLCVLYVRNICLLGTAGARAVLYPSYTAASILSLGESFQRGEALISGSLLLCTAARCALLLTFLSGSLPVLVPRCSRRHTVWISAVLAAAVCTLAAGTNAAFLSRQTAVQQILFPVLLFSALLPAAAVCRTDKQNRRSSY